MRRTRAADPKNKKGDKRERGEEGKGGGGKEKKREEKKKGRGLFWAWFMGVFSASCVFGKKNLSIPRFVFNQMAYSPKITKCALPIKSDLAGLDAIVALLG